MSSPISFTNLDLTVPLFDAQFDPYNRGYLVVGGGGGENKTGVANTIALLDVSDRSQIFLATQLDLSREEDSIQSLASLTTPTGLVTFAGINSSETAQKTGKNEHLKSFEVTFPKRKRGQSDEKDDGSGDIALTNKASLFNARREGKARPYQRLLKLSPVTSREAPSKRICVAATGDAEKNELVIFDATTATPDASSICARLSPPGGVEAVDLDVIEPEQDLFSLAYCTDHELYVYDLKYDFQSKKRVSGSSEPVAVWKASNPRDAKASMAKPKIRCLRWLSPQHILILQKSPQAAAELVIINLSSSSSSDRAVDSGEINLRRSLPKSLDVAAHLDICSLDADPASRERQILVAVAGADRKRESVIHILTLNHRPSDPDPWKQVWELNPFTVVNRVHPSNIMRITFSNFFPPKQDPHSTMSVATPAQYVSLASVAWGGTVVIETFSLTSTPTKPHDTNTARTSSSNPRGTPSVRWVLASNSLTERLTSNAGIYIIAFSILLFGILIQSYISLTGATVSSPFRTALSKLQPPGALVPSLRHGGSVVSSAVVGAASSAASAATSATAEFIPIPGVPHALKDLLDWHSTQSRSSFDEGPNAVPDQHHIHIQAPDPDASSSSSDPSSAGKALTGTLIPLAQRQEFERLREAGAKSWEELSEREKEKWAGRLREAGEFGENVPQSLVKGVLFSEWAAVVGGGIRDAVLNR